MRKLHLSDAKDVRELLDLPNQYRDRFEKALSRFFNGKGVRWGAVKVVFVKPGVFQATAEGTLEENQILSLVGSKIELHSKPFRQDMVETMLSKPTPISVYLDMDNKDQNVHLGFDITV